MAMRVVLFGGGGKLLRTFLCALGAGACGCPAGQLLPSAGTEGAGPPAERNRAPAAGRLHLGAQPGAPFPGEQRLCKVKRLVHSPTLQYAWPHDLTQDEMLIQMLGNGVFLGASRPAHNLRRVRQPDARPAPPTAEPTRAPNKGSAGLAAGGQTPPLAFAHAQFEPCGPLWPRRA